MVCKAAHKQKETYCKECLRLYQYNDTVIQSHYHHWNQAAMTIATTTMTTKKISEKIFIERVVDHVLKMWKSINNKQSDSSLFAVVIRYILL